MASSGPLTVTIRFAASLPDLPLTIQSPSKTSTLTLATLIRPHLPPTHASLRLRLIHAGRVLSPTDSLTASLRLSRQSVDLSSASARAKGKAPVRPPLPPGAPQSAIYVHATFSDTPLSAEELSKEQEEAHLVDKVLSSPNTQSPLAASSKHIHQDGSSRSSRRPPPIPISTTRSPSSLLSPATPSQRRPLGTASFAPTTPFSARPTDTGGETSTTPPPQGFDRLLSAGLSPLEIASLRSQFVAILAHTHTPDTMPNAAELRALEEAWLDNDTDAARPLAPSSSDEAGGQGGGSIFGGGINAAAIGSDEDSGGLEDMLWGNIMGFFWPVGAVFWLMREEGVWSQRRRVAVVTGALVNLAFSVMRAAS